MSVFGLIMYHGLTKVLFGLFLSRFNPNLSYLFSHYFFDG